jgi:FkbM family methyltransferase
MTVKSFAQNFEDVLLWRALKSVDDGRYVDVGAGHPEHHSVTKLFYDAGWSGINIEPLPLLADQLAKARPRDVNIQAAVSSKPVDVIELTVVDSWDELSTISDERAEELRAEGRSVTTTKVPVVRLDDVLAASGLRDVHFLKVDVEGAEIDVLNTLDLVRTRPWIIWAEVVSGAAETSPRDAIRERLGAHDYVHSYFDGLNDFYVAGEHADELLGSFSTPVNITDDFVVVSDTDHVMVDLIGEKLGVAAPAQASEVLQRVESVVRDRIDFELQLRDVEAQRREVEDQLASTERSKDEEIAAVRSELEAVIQGWRLKSEALEQTSFERERMVAWYAAEVSNFRKRWLRQENANAAQAAVNLAQAGQLEVERAHGRDAEARLAQVLRSTSWRVTLPMRVVRRPGTYLRALTSR